MCDEAFDLKGDPVLHRGPALWRIGADFLALSRADGYCLTAMGPAGELWSALDEPRTWSSLIAELSNRFGVAPTRVEEDLSALMRSLISAGFVVVQA
jgi:hypothetical protein